MKVTTEQEEAMQKLKEEVTLLIKKYPSRSTRNLQFEILNMRDTRYPSLKCFRVSYGWIGKMKKATLKPSQRSIVKEVAEKQLLQWFKNRDRSPFSNLVTHDPKNRFFQSPRYRYPNPTTEKETSN